MTTGNSILLLQGDAEASLLADAEIAIQTVFPGADVTVTRAWSTRPDWLGADAGLPPALVRAGLLPDEDLRALLAQRHQLVILPLLPAAAMPALRHRDGGMFLAHRALRAGWNAEAQAAIAAECVEVLPLSPEAAAAQFEPLVERLLADGTAVALCTAFRHVDEPLQFRRETGAMSLRETVRRTNLQVARLSQRTGCFVLDLDRPLAQEGGAPLQADCFGGGERAVEIALDEFAALLFEALPEGLAMAEAEMILSLAMPKVGAQMHRGTIHRLVAKVGDELRPGVSLLEVRVDLETDKAQDCPPLYFFRIIATERGVLRALNVAVGDVLDAGAPIGIVTSTAAEAADGATTRALRTTSVAIQIDPLSRR